LLGFEIATWRPATSIDTRSALLVATTRG